MNDPFNFASADFTPRNLTSPRTPVGGPWSGEYKMQHRAFPNSASNFSEFSTGGTESRNLESLNTESLNSESHGSFNSSNADSGNSSNTTSGNVGFRTSSLRAVNSVGYHPANLSSMSFNHEVRNSGDFISGAFNTSNPSIPDFSARQLGSPINSENFNLNAIPRGVKSGSLSTAGVNSASLHTTTTEPSRRSTGISQNAWPPSALSSSGTTFSKAYIPRSSDQASSTPAKSDSIPTSSSTLPGLLPDDGHNDTFVMDIDDRPEEIIAELKLQVESLVTVIVMARSQESGVAASSVLQGSDGIEIAHRIMNRLKALRMENEYLGALVGGKSTAILEAKNKRLERENAMLREKLHDTQKAKELVKHS